MSRDIPTAKSIKNDWSVKNKLYWHIDFTFKKDKNTLINKNTLMNLH